MLRTDPSFATGFSTTLTLTGLNGVTVAGARRAVRKSRKPRLPTVVTLRAVFMGPLVTGLRTDGGLLRGRNRWSHRNIGRTLAPRRMTGADADRSRNAVKRLTKRLLV